MLERLRRAVSWLPTPRFCRRGDRILRAREPAHARQPEEGATPEVHARLAGAAREFHHAALRYGLFVEAHRQHLDADARAHIEATYGPLVLARPVLHLDPVFHTRREWAASPRAIGDFMAEEGFRPRQGWEPTDDLEEAVIERARKEAVGIVAAALGGPVRD